MQSFFPTSGTHQEMKTSSQFEWAVQYYEAGQYEKALPSFLKLSEKGAEEESFQLVPFYLGMTYYRLRNWAKASEFLEAFNRVKTEGAVSKESRVALMVCYENQQKWQQATALASEIDTMNLYQDNQFLVKLIWARALSEQGEILGAKTILKDTFQQMSNFPMSENPDLLQQDTESDLWGRYYFVSILINEKECESIQPKEIKGKKPKFLFDNWFEAENECVKRALKEGSLDLFRSDKAFSHPAAALIEKALESYAAKSNQFAAKQANIEAKRQIANNARQHFYQVMGYVDELQKNLKIQELESPHLKQIRTRIDYLILSISSPSY